MRGGRHRLILVALSAVGLTVLAAGCSFESEIAVQLLEGAPVVVKQTTKVDVTPQRVQGTTTRSGQVVRIDCSITGIYDVDDPTGPAVLVQLFVVHLRTRPLPRGTPYQLDCAGPVIVELPTDASDIQATATDLQVALPVQAPLTSIALAFGKRLRAEPGTQFTLVGQPSLSAGDHTVELAFSLPEARTFREKVLYTASVSCGRSKYLQPIRPLVGWQERGHLRHRRPRDQAVDPRTWTRRRSVSRIGSALYRRGCTTSSGRIPGHPPHRRGRRLAHVARRRIRRRSGRVHGRPLRSSWPRRK